MPALPVLVPLAAAALLVALSVERLAAQRAVAVGACAAQLAVALALLAASASGEVRSYALGGWPGPFGIVLVVDRLAALMLTLTAVVALAAAAYAAAGWDARGRHFHALFQFQLVGLNGAFLTGDLFNLFVFFEVLLIASYCLLAHGLGVARLRAALHYVVLNLAASALFLIAVSLLYGVTGTLNMADLAVRAGQAEPADAPLVAAGALLLLVVFGVKAALFPLYFWLPGAYAAAAAPVAALFSIMTKVGVYAIIRVHGQVFGPDAGGVALVAAPWLVPTALVTLALGILGALAARSLAGLTAYLTVASVGTALAAAGLLTAAGVAAGIFYLVQSTLVIAALFLLGELIALQRGEAADALETGRPVAQPLLLGVLFLIAGMTVVGMPPFSGFLGKLMILHAARDATAGPWIWTVILATGLLALVGVARAGSAVFWRVSSEPPGAAKAGAAAAPAAALVAAAVLVVACAAPLKSFADATAAQILDRRAYVDAVLSPQAPPYRSGPREAR
ncbi:MAG: monovalent cation/H+ antiporter subunit D [Burkholderiales bacterium]|nr:monovalent cation/H+ antiporter subunit D [Burkholderiales bacterium]